MDVSTQLVREEVSTLFFTPQKPKLASLNDYRFRRLPEPLITVFLYILYEYRGDFLRQVDDLLGPYVADFVAGKRPVQPFAFGENTMKKMQKQAMDSSYFLDLCNLLVSTMDDPG